MFAVCHSSLGGVRPSAAYFRLKASLLLVSGCILLVLCSSQLLYSTTLVSIQVRPGGASVAKGNQRPYVAWGTYSNGVTMQLSSVTWKSSATNVATIDNSGLATATAQGTTTISATSGSITGSTGLTVTPPVVKSVVISPLTPSINVGTFEQFTSTSIFTDGSTQNSTAWEKWSSSDKSVAAITQPGLVNGMTAGTATITVSSSSGQLKSSTVITVDTPIGPGPTVLVPPSFFGIHTGMAHPKDPWPYVPNHGWRSHDDGVAWADINTALGVYDWSRFDQEIGKAQAHNADILYTLFETPNWAATNPGGCVQGVGSCNPPDDLNSDGTGTDQHFQNFVSALMAHAGPGKIKYFEVWNEPNIPVEWGGTVAQVVRLAKDAQAIIKAVDPQAVIVGPAPSSYNADYQSSMLAAGLAKYVDAFAFHGYGSEPEDLIKTITRNQTVFAQYGVQTKPFIDTEGSWGKFQSCTGNCMQYFTARWYLIQMALGVNRVFWYGWDYSNSGEFYNFQNGQLTLAGSTQEQIYNWTAGAQAGQLSQVGNTYTMPIVSTAGKEELVVWNTAGNATYEVPLQYQGSPYYNVDGTSGTAGSTLTIGLKPILLTSN